MNGILSACMCVLARNILFQSSCSLCSYVCIGLPRPPHPPKVKYSLSAGIRASNETEYFTLWGCAGPGRPIHTYKQREHQLWDRIFLANTRIWAERERNRWISCLLIVRKTVSGLPFQNYGSLTVCQTGNDDVWLCDWISKTLHK